MTAPDVISEARVADHGPVEEPSGMLLAGGVPLAGDEWVVWQLADSAFPTGGFAHSGGLEAAVQNGAPVRGAGLERWLEASLLQVTQGSLPFVGTVHAEPARLGEADALCDAFLTNHVAHRASRLQGRALVAAVRRIFKPAPGDGLEQAARSHLAPVFGAVTRLLEIPRPQALRLFVFGHVRSVLAAAVRLNQAGPMEAQALQHRFRERCAAAAETGSRLGLEDVANPCPMLELWHGTHDRLASRLFQT